MTAGVFGRASKFGDNLETEDFKDRDSYPSR